MAETERAPQRQRSIRRTTAILVVVALGVYAAFILAGVLRSQGMA